MKTILQFLAIILLSTTLGNAQEVTVNISLGTDYANQVYYKLSTQTETSFAANSWDIAFLRHHAMEMGIRVNQLIEVFEASNDVNNWETIDIADEGDWTQLYNSDTSWTGAFDQGSAPYGWGEYNIANHHVEGSVIFVLKYEDGTYRKFLCEDYFGGYTFRYATWNAGTTSWGADKTVTISNTNNPDNTYNYYSLQNDTEVVAEPATTDWDFVFTKYDTNLGVMYPVMGVLHSNEVTVAQNEEVGGMSANPALTYSDEINTIGYDWKTFNNTTFVYDVNPNQAYYVKYADDAVYRLYFTAFEGSSTGNLTFKYENVTASLGIEDVGDEVSFGAYPNPSPNKQINLVYDVSKFSAAKNEVAVYTVTGKKVFQKVLKSDSGFYNKSLNLSHLQSGVYVLQFKSGDTSVTKKIILQF